MFVNTLEQRLWRAKWYVRRSWILFNTADTILLFFNTCIVQITELQRMRTNINLLNKTFRLFNWLLISGIAFLTKKNRLLSDWCIDNYQLVCCFKANLLNKHEMLVIINLKFTENHAILDRKCSFIHYFD